MTTVRDGVTTTETELLDAIVELAHLLHLKVAHFRPARTASGSWVTAMVGDVGFPDLVIAGPRGRGVLFREVKSATGKLTAAQTVWLELTDGVVWVPEDWRSGLIERELRSIARTVAR